MGFIEDLKEINSLPNEHLKILFDEFKSNPLNNFDLVSAFEKKCLEIGIDNKKANILYNVLSYITDLFIEEKSIEGGINELETKILKNYINDINNIWGYIKNNISDLDKFILRRKEYKLTQIFDNINKFNIICDIRPVFDVKKEYILSYIFPIILSIDSNSSNSNINFEINEAELEIIQKKVNTTLSKLKVLKEKFKND